MISMPDSGESDNESEDIHASPQLAPRRPKASYKATPVQEEESAELVSVDSFEAKDVATAIFQDMLSKEIAYCLEKIQESDASSMEVAPPAPRRNATPEQRRDTTPGKSAKSFISEEWNTSYDESDEQAKTPVSFDEHFDLPLP